MNDNISSMTNGFFSVFNIFFILMLLLTIAVIGFVIALMFSPKLKSKMMGRQLKATKQILDDNKETIKDIHNLQADILVESTDNILDKHEKTIKKNVNKLADISEYPIEKAGNALKKGLSNTKECPECGKMNSENAKYCQECGTKLSNK